LTRDEFLSSLRREAEICIAIAARLDDADLPYRPTPASRSIGELLTYLCRCGLHGVLATMLGKDRAAHPFLDDDAPVALADFPERMRAQMAHVAEVLPLADWEGGCAKYWWGEGASLVAAMVETPLKWMTAYRTNLFLWAKECGHHDLDRGVCWAH